MARKIRLRGEALPLDLIVVAALALIAAAIAMNVQVGQGAIAFVLQALLLYALISAVLPENEPLGSLFQRTAVSIVLALVASLAEIAMGMQGLPVLIVSIMILILAVLAHIRRSAVPRRRRFSLYASRYGLRSNRRGISQKIAPAIVLLLMIVAISFGYVTLKNERHGGFTEFYVTGLSMKSDRSATATVGVINHEGVEANYTIAVEMNGERAAERDAHLADGGAYEEALEWSIPEDAGDLCTLRILLYRNGEVLKDYQKTLRVSDYITEAYEEKSSATGEAQPANITSNVTAASKNISEGASPRSTPVASAARRSSSGSGGSGSSSSSVSSSKSGVSRDESPALDMPKNESRTSEGNITGMNISGAKAEPDENATAVANATPVGVSIMDALKNASAVLNQTKELVSLSDSSTNASTAPPNLESAAHLPATSVNGTNRSISAPENRSQNVHLKTHPEIERLEPDKESPQKVGTTVVWTVSVSTHADGVSYRFFLNGRPITGWSGSPSWTWYTSGIPAGEYNVSVCVRGSNNTDCEDTAWSLYTLLPVNLPPELTALVSDPDGPQPQGAQIRLSAAASDAENDTLLYRFYVDGLAAGEWSESGVFVMNTSGLAPGNHTVRVDVRDGLHSDRDDSLERVIEIVASNAPPGITGLSPDRESPQPVGSVITWTAYADDPDNDTILYRFFVDDVAVSDWSDDPRFVWNTSGQSEGEHRVSVLAKDKHHEDHDRRDVVFSLKMNSPPRALSLLPDRESPQPVGSRITWSALAEDPDSDPILYRFLVDGVAVSDWSSSAVFELDTSRLSPGNHTISVYVRDNMHVEYDAKEKGFELSAPNRPPAGLKLLPSPESPQTVGSVITWTASANDPDNDTLLYRFSLNGRAVTDWSTSGNWMWNTSGLSPGEYMVGVWVRDGEHASPTSFDSAQTSKFILTPENRPPELISLTPERAGPYEPGDEVVWTVEARDPEGDALLYRFAVDGVAVSDWSGAGRLSLRVPDVGRHTITVSVRDGSHEAGQSITSEFTVEPKRAANQPPVIESLTPDLSSPQHAGISVVWTASAHDPENDPIMYRFLVDGSPATDWSPSGKFTWNTVGLAAGDHNITVEVRDGGSTSSMSQIYTIRSIVDEALSGIGSGTSAALGSKNISSVRVGR